MLCLIIFRFVSVRIWYSKIRMYIVRCEIKDLKFYTTPNVFNVLLAHFLCLLPSATKLRMLCFYRCVSVHRGGAIPACFVGCIPACLAAGLQGGIQAHTQGGSLGGSVQRGEGVPAPRDVAFCYGLLVWWPSD